MTVLSRSFVGLCFYLLLNFAGTASAKQPYEWSDTDPSISITHIFQGQINKKGKATGFHYAGIEKPTYENSPHLKQILSKPNKVGVYTAIIEVWDAKGAQWKSKFSSLFPDHFTRPKIITAILAAFKGNTLKAKRKWRGKSGQGFDIEGYMLKDGRIITAYPIYKMNE
ncbi:MAG: EndoU domain-containing protein [Sneathiella sp.]